MIYLRLQYCRQTETGGIVALLWRARITVEVKALRIWRRAVFCCDCSLLARLFYPVHQISEPKSDLDITHAW
jgi:hypothetical protein